MRLLRKILRRGITRRPGRTIFSVLSIVIGVMLLTGISLATSSWKYSEHLSYAEANMADFVVYTEMLPQNIADTIANLDNVKTVAGRLFITTTMRFQGWSQGGVLLFGVEVPSELDRVKIVEGNFFSHDYEEAVVVDHSHYAHYAPVGKRIWIAPPINRSLPIVGTFKSMWAPGGAILIPIKTAQEMLGLETEFNSVLVQVADKSRLSETVREVEASLKDYRVLTVVYEGKTLPPFTFEPYLIGLTNSLKIVGFLAILVGGALIYNILDLAVSEEYREIGTFKALGFTVRQVLSVYMTRGLLLGGIGSIVGAFSGLWLGHSLLGQYTTLAMISHTLFEIDYAAMFSYAAVGICLVGLCSLPSALRASKVIPHLAISQGREATSSESGTSRLLGGRIVPIGYAIRSLLRKKNRVIGMIFVLAVSTMLYATSITATETFRGNIDDFFDQEYVQDIWVSMGTVEIEPTLNILMDVEGVRKVVPLRVGTAWSKGFSFGVYGIPPSVEFDVSMLTGEWFTSNQNAVVPTEFVARAMGLHVGDNLTLSTLSTVPNNITVQVTGIARDLLANTVYMPLEKTNKLFTTSGMNVALVYVEDGVDPSNVAFKVKSIWGPRCSLTTKNEVRQVIYDYVISAYVYLMDIVILLAFFFSLFMTSTIIMMNVNERRREFATLKAIGVTPGQIRNSVLIEILIVGAIGGCLGIILSLAFVFILIQVTSIILFSVQFMSIPLENIRWSIVLSLITSLLSGLIPALSASRTRTAEALRYE